MGRASSYKLTGTGKTGSRLAAFGWGIFLFGFLLLFLPAAFAASGQTLPADNPAASSPPPPAPTEAAAEAAPPSLVIIVWDLGNGQDTRVTMTFARQIDHPALEQRISELGKAAGWRNWNIKLRDELFSTEQQMQTSASFNNRGMVDRAAGKFSLNPLLEAFAGEGAFRIAFVVPGLSNFSGPDSFRTDRWGVQLLTGEGMYEYEVRPLPGKQSVPVLPSARAGKLMRIGLILLLLALSGGLIVVIVWLWYGKKNRALTPKPGDKNDGN